MTKKTTLKNIPWFVVLVLIAVFLGFAGCGKQGAGGGQTSDQETVSNFAKSLGGSSGATTVQQLGANSEEEEGLIMSSGG